MTGTRWRRSILACATILVVGAALWGQYTMWQRYGVFDWWSAKPRFLKVNGRDYERGHDIDPGPHYCIMASMFPFDYPIAGDTEDGPAGRPCEPPYGTPSGVYLHWKDGHWTAYQLQGSP